MATGQLDQNERYKPLFDWLSADSRDEIWIKLADLEEAAGCHLPERAWSDRIWWYSTPHNTWARSWLAAGFSVALDITDESVTFKREEYEPRYGLAEIEKMHLMQTQYARRVLAGSRLANASRGWWEPHRVYILHNKGEDLYKVGLTNARSDRRIRQMTAHGRATVFSSIIVPNRWDAILVEGRVLDLTEHARRFADAFNYHHGRTEHWSDSVAPPDLKRIASELESDDSLTHWNMSVSRDDHRAVSEEL